MQIQYYVSSCVNTVRYRKDLFKYIKIFWNSHSLHNGQHILKLHFGATCQTNDKSFRTFWFSSQICRVARLTGYLINDALVCMTCHQTTVIFASYWDFCHKNSFSSIHGTFFQFIFIFLLYNAMSLEIQTYPEEDETNLMPTQRVDPLKHMTERIVKEKGP